MTRLLSNDGLNCLVSHISRGKISPPQAAQLTLEQKEDLLTNPTDSSEGISLTERILGLAKNDRGGLPQKDRDTILNFFENAEGGDEPSKRVCDGHCQ